MKRESVYKLFALVTYGTSPQEILTQLALRRDHLEEDWHMMLVELELNSKPSSQT